MRKRKHKDSSLIAPRGKENINGIIMETQPHLDLYVTLLHGEAWASEAALRELSPGLWELTAGAVTLCEAHVCVPTAVRH